MRIKMNAYKQEIKNYIKLFIFDLGLTDKKIMEYGMYLFAIVLFIGAAGAFKFIGIYLPALFFLIRACLKGTIYKFWKSPIFIFLILFAFSGILSVFISRDLWQSLVFFEKYHIRPILIYLVIVTAFQNIRAFQKLLHLIALTSFFYILWSYYEYFYEIITFGSIGRVTSLNAAWPLLYIFSFVIREFFVAKTRKKKLFWALIAYLSVVSLVISGQRSAVLGIFAICAIWILYLNWKTKMIFVFSLTFCIVFFVVLAVSFPAVSTVMQDYVIRGIESAGRSDLLTLYWKIFEEHFWLGVGLDNDTISAVYLETERSGLLPHFMMPHNYFLTTAVRQGVLGLLSFGLMILVTLISLARKVFRQNFDDQKASGIALLACMLGMYVFYATFTEIVLMPLAVILSLSAVFINLNNKQVAF